MTTLWVSLLRLLVFLAAFALAASAAGPERIISASPSITEMLYALGLGDRVVAVTTFCHFPPEVRDKPKIGTYLRPSMETIVALQPDLIVLLQEHGSLVDRLKSTGLETLALSHNDLDGIYDSIRTIAEATGTQPRAAELISEMQERLVAVRRQTAGRERRSTMFIVGRTPGTIADLVIVGKGPFLNDLIELAGGVNVFFDAVTHYPRIPREEIYSRRPEVIIDMGDMADTDNVTAAHRRSVAALWSRLFPDLPAVSEGRVYPVANDIFVVPGPRVVEAAEELLRMIHPETAE